MQRRHSNSCTNENSFFFLENAKVCQFILAAGEKEPTRTHTFQVSLQQRWRKRYQFAIQMAGNSRLVAAQTATYHAA